MAYRPTESLNGTWYARNRLWPSFQQHNKDRVSDFPDKFRGLTVADLPDNKMGRIVGEWCDNWRRHPESIFDPAWKRGEGLLLHGKPGRGKTRTASIAGQHVSNLGWSTKFVSVANLYDLSLQVIRAKDPDEEERLASAMACYESWDGWRLVVLDDLGKEHKTSSRWAQDNIDRLIRSRFAGSAPTIVTTNMSPDEIDEVYGESMYSYIHEAFWVVEVSDRVDFRLRDR